MKRRKHLPARPPMLVMRQIHNKDLEIKERMALNKFTMGVATGADFDLFMDMANMLLLAGSSDENRAYATDYAENEVIPTLAKIKARFDKMDKLGVSAAERKVLIGLIEFSYQFWARQPIELYHVAGKELKAYHASLMKQRREAAATA